ncbi:MAG: hypothetical protein EOO56_21830 [Hymenobacter sp.]|nr:MAG: hypothetical protein EOO56_21830 [Hymenobacter sp.]
MDNQEQLSERQIFDWQFEELIKTLIIFTLPAEKQIEANGYGCVGDDLAADFDSYYCHIKNVLLAQCYINHAQYISLEAFDALLNKYVGAKYYDFWCDPVRLATDENWEQIRISAKQVLDVMGKSHLGLRINISLLPSASGDGKVVQVIKNELIEKE